MKKLFLLALAAFAFTACSNDDNETPVAPDYDIVDFEAAKLGTDGYIWGKPLATEQDDVDYNQKPIKSNIYYGTLYTEKKADVITLFTDYGHTYDTWNGFVISNHTDRETEGPANDKSVYATGGASASKQFAMACYGAWTPNDKGVPTVKFTSAVKAHSVAVANSTYTYLYFTKSIVTAEKPDFKVVVTGYNGTTKTGDASLMLVSGTTVKAGWETLDLSSLGSVTSLTFTVECKDQMAPYYFCIDNLSYEK